MKYTGIKKYTKIRLVKMLREDDFSTFRKKFWWVSSQSNNTLWLKKIIHHYLSIRRIFFELKTQTKMNPDRMNR